jgi:hypothetical protein
MPRVRTRKPRAASPNPSPELRKAARAMLWRFDQIRAWKEAVNVEAWRQAAADGSHHCDPARFEAAEAGLEASGVKRPPEAWFAELQEAMRWLARLPPEAEAR